MRLFRGASGLPRSAACHRCARSRTGTSYGGSFQVRNGHTLRLGGMSSPNSRPPTQGLDRIEKAAVFRWVSSPLPCCCFYLVSRWRRHHLADRGGLDRRRRGLHLLVRPPPGHRRSDFPLTASLAASISSSSDAASSFAACGQTSSSVVGLFAQRMMKNAPPASWAAE